MVSLVLAQALTDKFGSDTVADIQQAMAAYRDRLTPGPMDVVQTFDSFHQLIQQKRGRFKPSLKFRMIRSVRPFYCPYYQSPAPKT
jgi:hypothetical protein